MDKNAKIYVAGHRGLVGSAIVRRLKVCGYENILFRGHLELDLTDQAQTVEFIRREKPDYIFLAAAKVGGILANNEYPAEFIYQNLMMELNVIHAARLAGVARLLFLGSSCVYPRQCPQPIREEHLLSGYLEPTNEAYAVAKIAGLKMCESYNRQYGTGYIGVMPINLYGPGDSYDLATCHVLPALLRKAHEAKVRGDEDFVVWGSGNAMREFMYADDLASACVFLMERDDIRDGIFNIGAGRDMTIRELAGLICEVTGFKGRIVFDHSKPDGTPRKLLDTSRMDTLGWRPETSLRDGLDKTYQSYLAHLK